MGFLGKRQARRQARLQQKQAKVNASGLPHFQDQAPQSGSPRYCHEPDKSVGDMREQSTDDHNADHHNTELLAKREARRQARLQKKQAKMNAPGLHQDQCQNLGKNKLEQLVHLVEHETERDVETRKKQQVELEAQGPSIGSVAGECMYGCSSSERTAPTQGYVAPGGERVSPAELVIHATVE